MFRHYKNLAGIEGTHLQIAPTPVSAGFWEIKHTLEFFNKQDPSKLIVNTLHVIEYNILLLLVSKGKLLIGLYHQILHHTQLNSAELS